MSTLDKSSLGTLLELLEGILAIKRRGGLFERAAPGLDGEELFVTELEDRRASTARHQENRVGVLVENDRSQVDQG